MDNISIYLQRFKLIDFSQGRLKDVICASIKEVCGFEIDPSLIKIQKTDIVISVSGARKMELFLKKKKLEEVILSNVSKKNISLR